MIEISKMKDASEQLERVLAAIQTLGPSFNPNGVGCVSFEIYFAEMVRVKLDDTYSLIFVYSILPQYFIAKNISIDDRLISFDGFRVNK